MIQYFCFSKGKLVKEDSDPGFLRVALYEEDIQVWVDAEQPSAEETKMLLEDVFNFHPLAIEDCVAVSERPKIDQYEGYLFMVIHAIDFSPIEHQFSTTELNMFIGKNFLVTFHRDPLRSVIATIDSIRKNPTSIARAPDRLSYHILDVLLDRYEPTLDTLADDISGIEQNVLISQSTDTLNDILRLKGQVQRLRQIMAPQRDVISKLAHGEYSPVRTTMLPYYRDLLDRIARFADTADGQRESLSNTVQILLNLQQNRMNQVVKVLTVLATLSTPVLVVTSFYGMNFNHWPKMASPVAYPWVFGVTAAFTAALYWFLKRKNWL